VVLPGARIGADCNICSHVFIENDVVIGDGVTIKNGVQLWDGVTIEQGVFVGPNVSFTNDRFPRSKQRLEPFLRTTIGVGASIGANATVLPGLSVGAGAMVGAGAVVTKNVPPNAILVGNPAIIVGYVGTTAVTDAETATGNVPAAVVADLGVGGCRLYTLPLVPDMRGSLSVAEYERHIPFVPKRCFWVFDVPNQEVRGEHAHISLHQYLICVKGSVSVVVDDASRRREVLLDQPNLALHIPPHVWGIQYKYSQDAVLLVLASDAYDASDYIRNYADFVDFIQKKAQS
jgi:acetyltransferase-like isoleucine patch superfamily enzyme/dTDP-4-dehydrorhamnose 3,5-epimerase-like enzyme